MSRTVIEYVISRLHQEGARDVFGVAGDYAFPVADAVCAEAGMRWVGCCNELNAACAADGYSRLNGFSVLSTTYGVGELSALNGIAGAFAENVAVFHIVGMPDTHIQKSDKLVHHTTGCHNFEVFCQAASPFVCAHAILTADNVVEEMERLLSAMIAHRRPVYLGVPADVAVQRMDKDLPPPCDRKNPSGNKDNLKSAIDTILDMVRGSRKICMLPGILAARYGVREKLKRLVVDKNIPFATMFMDKGVLDETLPEYIGMYNGRLMNPDVREYVESCDCILGIGVRMSDANTGNFTADIRREQFINIMPDHVYVGDKEYSGTDMEDILDALAESLPSCSKKYRPDFILKPLTPDFDENDYIHSDFLYSRIQMMLREGDTVITETGNSSLGLAFIRLPDNVSYLSQPLWGAIGWATPASFGAAMARPEKRTVLVTGEGAHQLTAQEICQFYRFGLKPVIFVINNDGYLIERFLCRDGEACYNDIAGWNYSLLPEALGCKDWLVQRVATCGQLNEVIARIEETASAAYIEVLTGRYDAAGLTRRLHVSVMEK